MSNIILIVYLVVFSLNLTFCSSARNFKCRTLPYIKMTQPSSTFLTLAHNNLSEEKYNVLRPSLQCSTLKPNLVNESGMFFSRFLTFLYLYSKFKRSPYNIKSIFGYFFHNHPYPSASLGVTCFLRLKIRVRTLSKVNASISIS